MWSAVTRADGGGIVRAYGSGAHPCQVRVDFIGAGARRRDAIILIYFKKFVIATSQVMSADSLLLCCTIATS
jgi:hypothetical protein